MGQVLHGCATTTEAIRRAIQNSQESLRALTKRYPWDATAHRSPGGSSSGAGVSLCEGSALLALDTDIAASVRLPAAMTGNAGLKLTKDRWSTEGIVPLGFTFDTPGILARSMADAGFSFAALDPDLGDGFAFLRGVPTGVWVRRRCARASAGASGNVRESLTR